MSASFMEDAGLRGGPGSRYDDSDSDPMASMANLADVMLVFACGLMLALITYWNVDISTVTEMLQEDQVAEVQTPEELESELRATDGTSYIDMGRVYMDPTTGKYYMLSEGQGGGQSTDGSAAAGADGVSPDGQQPSGQGAAGLNVPDRSQGGD